MDKMPTAGASLSRVLRKDFRRFLEIGLNPCLKMASLLWFSSVCGGDYKGEQAVKTSSTAS
jgi:hypothetical protein